MFMMHFSDKENIFKLKLAIKVNIPESAIAFENAYKRALGSRFIIPMEIQWICVLNNMNF